jgi:hypothetical protein
MKCMDCPLKYVGQTGRTFNTRYKEHIYDITTNNSNIGYANHILNTGHSYGTITHYGDNENRKEGKIFEHIGKILYIRV